MNHGLVTPRYRPQLTKTAFTLRLVLLVASLLVSSCSVPFLTRPPAMDATPEQIVEAVARNMEKLHDLEGRVQVHIESPDVEETVSAKILLRRPDWLRIEVKGPLGVTVGNVLMKEDTVLVYYPLGKYMVQGKPTAEHFEIMTGIQLDIGDFQSMFMGDAGITLDVLEHLDDFQISGKEYVLSVRDGDGSRKHWVEPRHLMVTRSESYTHEGVLTSRQRYRYYREFDSVRIPTRIEIEKVAERHRVELLLQDGKVNRGLADERFRLQIPSDVERIELN